uniref:Uncharacterized protein n=1 Tax=Chromera velia CCMP2878 TaxID=1169474 RepID=A0A0G4H949_9ALVE|eukprot:Cvel_5936.t1-p1 / transcript=Cvel_5936.t1 / gene=Cvel_5936 / organism=Chromera_velia_CCMP2878 / gene_product=hypothetical protein / transcript_product=hypothetical protein / location=Cvel_scaffold284:18672-19082(+) / protein_length=137 / sequence_SO=supercontig / SO=protein_coding / is_pseudo=false
MLWVTSASLLASSGVSALLSPLLFLFPEKIVRTTGALGPTEKFHPIAKRFLVAFEITAFGLALCGLRSIVRGSAEDRVFWARLTLLPTGALAYSMNRFQYEKGHAMHGKKVAGVVFAGMSLVLLLGGFVFHETAVKR